MSDKSFGDYASRNIVKNPLLSTAVTGLSIEDLTHNAVLVPVAPNQGQITRPETGTYSQTLGNTELEHTIFPSGDSNSNILITQPPTSQQSHNYESQTGQQYDKKQDLHTATVSKASTKTEDDFDVNEYFARLQGTRYVSAPLHSHTDPNANLAETEENLEEINLNDDKTAEVQQSLTADIAQNFSQLPNVLPHVASAVFSSFSNMWSMKSREQTPDDRAQSYQDVQFQGNPVPNQFQSFQGSQKYQDVQFQGAPDLNQFESQGFAGNVSSVPLMKTEGVVKDVAPPPKEPPISGVSIFRLTTRKKYAQIPGLSTGESQQIAFNPLTQNVPSYFTPAQDDFKNNEGNKQTDTIIDPSNTETPAKDKNENYNIFTPVNTSKTEENTYQAHGFMPESSQPKLHEEKPPQINLQNHIPDIPPPPMFSTQRRESSGGKSVLPPSVARRIGSNQPVMKQQMVQPTSTDNIFIPTFDSTPSEPKIPPDNATVPTYHATSMPQQQETSVWQTPFPPQVPQQLSAAPQKEHLINAPPHSSIGYLPQPDPNSTKNMLPVEKSAPYLFQPTNQPTAPTIFTPVVPEPKLDILSPPHGSGLISSPAVSSSIPPPINLFSQQPPLSQTTSVLAPSAPIGSYPGNIPNMNETPGGSTLEGNPPSQPPKALAEPPKAIGASNFRMNKKRPQYYSGPIEGIGSISNCVKPIIPTVDSSAFQGALFTPEQVQSDTNTPSFDISKPVETGPSYAPFNFNPVDNQAASMPIQSFYNQDASYANTAPFQNYGQQLNTSFDINRSTSESYEPKEEAKQLIGFGIIGSLKSKLSNIDINKIQSSVTTFFDPGYNNTRKDDFVTQENTPFNPQQYHAEPQSNIDIFVPSVDQSNPYSTGGHGFQNLYGQAGYDHSNQYTYPQHSQPFDHNYSHQTFSSSYYSDQQQSQNQFSNVFSQGNTTENIGSIGAPLEVPTNVQKDIPTADPYKNEKEIETALHDKEPTADSGLQHNKDELEKTPLNLEKKSFEEIKSNIIEPESSTPTDLTNKKAQLSGILPCPGEYQDNILSSSLLDSFKVATDPMTLFNKPSESQSYLSSAFEGNHGNIPYQYFPIDSKAGNDDGVMPNILGFGATKDTGSLLDNIVHKGIDTKVVHDVKGKEDSVPKDNLLQSLSKDEIPILGVSSVPLFGLSTIIADKTKESDENSHLPLYERVKTQAAEDRTIESIDTFKQTPGDYDKLKTDSILDGNRKFSIDRSSEKDDVGYGVQISTTTSIFSNEAFENAKEADAIVDRQINLFENIGAEKKVDDLDISYGTVLGGTGSPQYIKDIIQTEEIENVSELNICETCREVNKPDDKEVEKDDLTTQLIENITSPIQLSNPVEVPLTEDNSAERDVVADFNVGQFEEISHITEETIGTIHVQSVTELLEDDAIKTMNYGWSAPESYVSNPIKPYDYGFPADPTALAFFGEPQTKDEVQTHASEELKSEVIHQEVILPRQISIPSAPPAEEDSGVLDVNSIELDAKEDFPIYEEFKIEPSETDDDKIDLKATEETGERELDSFTNRVEKFKKLEEVSEFAEKPVQKLTESQNQPLSMASYFDTGNYAADTHYRNTLNSPSNIVIPPGFEEEFKRRLALSKEKDPLKTIPDTTTQTKVTTSVTTAQSFMPVGYNVVCTVSNTLKIDTLSERPLLQEAVKPAEPFSSIFGSQDDKPSSFLNYAPFENLKSQEIKSEIIPGSSKYPTATPMGLGFAIAPEDTMFNTGAVEIPKASSIFDSRGSISESSSIFASNVPKIPEPSYLFSASNLGVSANKPDIKAAAPVLPDPMNFFTDSAPEMPSENVNRLASYFSSPPKKEHPKSFFELSQSQNHYKHAISQNYGDLIKDLTSVQNLAVPTDQTIRHVNYFTVEYDVMPKLSKGDNPECVLTDPDDKDLESLNHCSYCTALIYDKQYKVKEAMNSNTEEGSAERNMEPPSSRPANSVTVNFDGITLNEETNEGAAIQAEHRSSPEYGPVKHHWFYRVDVEDKSIWRGFSVQDSRALERSFLSPDLNENTVVPTDGGRYDVNLMGRLRIPVYWSDKPTNVRRCSWFYKGTTDPRYVPYTETVADKLEEEYWHGITTGEWHRRLVLPNGEVVVMHGPNVMVHFLHSDAFSSPPQSSSRPRVVRRGHDDSEIEDAEPSSIDHLLLLCHGVGSACDMRFRSVEEVVEDFRATSLQLVQSHYKNSYDQGIVSRVEVLPISWHEALHSGETGVDRRLAQITLDSIPRLRNFTNDTVLDVLFYTSPVFCQTILNTVCQELNRVYQLFKKRNPAFDGGVSLGGHSLGSVILYDLLCHQIAKNDHRDSQSSEKQYVPGPAATGRPGVLYPQLEFEPAALYALGSPIAIFECIRGVQSLGADFALPTCKNFFNIFHPYDPIAYRIEPLINPRLKELKPYLIPHHKGRKRMHLELKDTMARVGADLKQKLVESLRNTWNKWKPVPADGTLDRVVEEDMDREQLYDENKEELAKEKELSTPEILGRLNAGRRVDYVLQEAPLEMINEYLFAMSSHVGYWESEDTMLLMLREIYSALGVQPDSTVPQQSMSVQRTRRLEGSSSSSENPSTSGSNP